MGAVQLCLFVMDTHRLPKNLSGRLILETLIISPFKSICMVVTVMSGFNSELYSRDYNRVSFIILVKITLILRAFVFLTIHTIPKESTDLPFTDLLSLCEADMS